MIENVVYVVKVIINEICMESLKWEDLEWKLRKYLCVRGSRRRGWSEKLRRSSYRGRESLEIRYGRSLMRRMC